jgi:hypothetical protein
MQYHSLSVGYLDSAVRLLRIVTGNPGSSLTQVEEIAGTDDIVFRGTSHSLISIALEIGWILVDEHHELTINNDLLDYYDDSSIKLQRELLWKYIEHKRPPWAKHLHRGVKNARMRISDSNEKQVFQDLNLFVEPDETDQEIIEWWARAGIFSRSIENQFLLETGNSGEILSLDYERNRTGLKPLHMAYYSDSCGYDIESRVGPNDSSPLYIEVKSSVSKWQRANLFLSRSEFRVCVKNGDNYVFHLWDLSSETKKLIVVKGDEIVKRAPIDSEGGEWKKMSIPFDEFDWEKPFEIER